MFGDVGEAQVSGCRGGAECRPRMAAVAAVVSTWPPVITGNRLINRPSSSVGKVQETPSAIGRALDPGRRHRASTSCGCRDKAAWCDRLRGDRADSTDSSSSPADRKRAEIRLGGAVRRSPPIQPAFCFRTEDVARSSATRRAARLQGLARRVDDPMTNRKRMAVQERVQSLAERRDTVSVRRDGARRGLDAIVETPNGWSSSSGWWTEASADRRSIVREGKLRERQCPSRPRRPPRPGRRRSPQHPVVTAPSACSRFSGWPSSTPKEARDRRPACIWRRMDRCAPKMDKIHRGSIPRVVDRSS